MKTEMKMMPNGNYEKIISPIQHECYAKYGKWKCKEYGWQLGKLILYCEYSYPDEEGYDGTFEEEIEVIFCPFCGYQPERSKREDFYGHKAIVDSNGIITFEDGKQYNLNQPIEDTSF